MAEGLLGQKFTQGSHRCVAGANSAPGDSQATKLPLMGSAVPWHPKTCPPAGPELSPTCPTQTGLSSAAQTFRKHLWFSLLQVNSAPGRIKSTFPSPMSISTYEIWLTENHQDTQVGQCLPSSPFAQHRGREITSKHFSIPKLPVPKRSETGKR